MNVKKVNATILIHLDETLKEKIIIKTNNMGVSIKDYTTMLYEKDLQSNTNLSTRKSDTTKKRKADKYYKNSTRHFDAFMRSLEMCVKGVSYKDIVTYLHDEIDYLQEIPNCEHGIVKLKTLIALIESDPIDFEAKAHLYWTDRRNARKHIQLIDRHHYASLVRMLDKRTNEENLL